MEFETETGLHQRVNNLYQAFWGDIYTSRFGARQMQVVYVSTFFTDVNVVDHGYLYAIRYR